MMFIYVKVRVKSKNVARKHEDSGLLFYMKLVILVIHGLPRYIRYICKIKY
jgi:hypothetical protein